jgi:hypothetical protein
MSHTKKYLFLFLLLGIGMFFYSCQHDDTVLTEETEIAQQRRITKIVTLNEVYGLEAVIRKVNTIRNQGSNGSFPHSENSNYLGTLNLDNIISVSDANGNESFTIDIENTESGIHFEKLRLVKYMDGYIASIQRFEPTQNWYNTAENITTFSGQIHNKSLNGNTLWSATLQNGVVQTSSNGSGAEDSVPCYIFVYWVDGDGQ